MSDKLEVTRVIAVPTSPAQDEMLLQNKSYRRRWWILMVLSLCLLLVAIDGTIVNVALSSIAIELSASTSELQWISEAYTLLLAGFLLSSGTLNDRFGSRRILIVGIAIFGSASLGAAFAPSPLILIGARAVMGIGGALIMPTTLSTIRRVFPEEEERVRAIGIWGATASLGIVIGPLLGGWLLDSFWWGSIFLVNIPLALLTIVACSLLLPHEGEHTQSSIDWGGAAFSTIGMIGLVYVITEIPTFGWKDPIILGVLIISGLALGTFLFWERQVYHPMLDLSMFRSRQFTLSNIANALSYFALFGALFAVTQYLQLVLGYSPFVVGLALIPEGVIILITSLVGAWLTKYFSRKFILVAGLFLIAGGSGVLSLATVKSGYPFILSVMLLTITGIGIAGTAATDLILGAISVKQASSAAAVSETFLELGGTFGIAILGSILSVGYTSSLQASPGIQSIPATVRGQMLESLGAAVKAAETVGGAEGHRLLLLAQEAFTRGMTDAALAGAAIALIAACLTLFLLPTQSVQHSASMK